MKIIAIAATVAILTLALASAQATPVFEKHGERSVDAKLKDGDTKTERENLATMEKRDFGCSDILKCTEHCLSTGFLAGICTGPQFLNCTCILWICCSTAYSIRFFHTLLPSPLFSAPRWFFDPPFIFLVPSIIVGSLCLALAQDENKTGPQIITPQFSFQKMASKDKIKFFCFGDCNGALSTIHMHLSHHSNAYSHTPHSYTRPCTEMHPLHLHRAHRARVRRTGQRKPASVCSHQ